VANSSTTPRGQHRLMAPASSLGISTTFERRAAAEPLFLDRAFRFLIRHPLFGQSYYSRDDFGPHLSAH
jgi:hypothetical protein